MNYSNMKYNELLKLCKERNIHGYSHKKKARLIELLEENDWIFLSTKHDVSLTTHDIFKPWYDFYRDIYSMDMIKYATKCSSQIYYRRIAML